MSAEQILTSAKKQLPSVQQKNYVVQTWFTESDLAWLYTHTHLAISRAGANTVQELTLAAIPTLYIPLPHAHRNEQFHNAQNLVDQQAALLALQPEADSTKLVAAMHQLEKQHAQIKKQLHKLQPSANGAEQLLALIEHLDHESN